MLRKARGPGPSIERAGPGGAAVLFAPRTPGERWPWWLPDRARSASGSAAFRHGKTLIGRILRERLRGRGLRTEFPNNDEVRRDLSFPLGFDRDLREAHAFRVAYAAKILVRLGAMKFVALISP